MCFPANTTQYHKHNFTLHGNYNISVCKGRHCEKLPFNLRRNYQKIKNMVKKQLHVKHLPRKFKQRLQFYPMYYTLGNSVIARKILQFLNVRL